MIRGYIGTDIGDTFTVVVAVPDRFCLLCEGEGGLEKQKANQHKA